MSEPKEFACVICGFSTKLPPYCIECDMTGQSYDHLNRHLTREERIARAPAILRAQPGSCGYVLRPKG